MVDIAQGIPEGTRRVEPTIVDHDIAVEYFPYTHEWEFSDGERKFRMTNELIQDLLTQGGLTAGITVGITGRNG